jgi:DNA-binding NtrC family response regulator
MEAQSRILVVDDEAVQLFVLREALSRVGKACQVEIALSAGEALDKVNETRFDLILTDLGMPDMDGIALTEAVRAMGSEATVVWITAYGCQQFAVEAERLGVYLCLDKPVRTARIRETVQEALRAREHALEST